jgi:hypothetical protein
VEEANLRNAQGWLALVVIGAVATYAIRSHRRGSDTRTQLGGSRGILVDEAVTISRPLAEVYQFWQRFEEFPRFMTHLVSVTRREGDLSHWIAKGPAGMTVEWNARIINDIENELIGWQSVEGSTGRGLHVVMPLTPRRGWSECLAFSKAVANVLVRTAPDVYTTAFARIGRASKILVDYLRNNRTNTSIAAFSTRARPSAPISVPIAWERLTPRLDLVRLSLPSLKRHLARLQHDPWAGYWRCRQQISAAAMKVVGSV